jgi:hypothetical protein|tara:strand:+ start:139 stop:366 length:228 start_codon:yes stop_codon:yes gene_type:complete
MIDTDKYEGHDNWEGTKVNMANEANKLLIADAPLLLAEVKRLREVIREIKELSEGWLRWDERGIKMAKIIMEMIE